MSRTARFAPVLLALLITLVAAPPAQAGSPHFIKSDLSLTISGDTLTVSGKEAGLGSEAQVHIEVTAEAACVNGGSNRPKAANKATFSAGGDFPVQNGKAEFSLSLTASFQPDCAPPMTVVWSPVTITDTTNGISVTLR